MYAVVQTGGKQYKVSEGDKFSVEKLSGEVGDTIALGEVLAIGGDNAQIGAPLIKGASVSAEIIAQEKNDKVIVFKKKRRHNYRRKLGHRQEVTTLKITGISASGGAAKKAAPAKAEASAEKPAAAKKPAAKKPAAKKAD